MCTRICICTRTPRYVQTPSNPFLCSSPKCAPVACETLWHSFNSSDFMARVFMWHYTCRLKMSIPVAAAPGSNVYASFASEPASSELPKPAGSDLYSSIAPPTITSTNSASVADSRNPYSMYALPAGDSSLSGAVGGDTAEPPHSGSAGGRERKGRGTVSTVSRSSTKLGGSRGGKRSESDRRKGVPAAPSSGFPPRPPRPVPLCASLPHQIHRFDMPGPAWHTPVPV